MHNKCFLSSAILFCIPFALQAMDQLPHEVIERGIIPQMDSKTLENFGSTNKANATAVEKYRKDHNPPKNAILVCPPIAEVWQALHMNTDKTLSEESGNRVCVRTDEDVTIGGKKWTGRAFKPRPQTPFDPLTIFDIPEVLKNAQLTCITLDRSAIMPGIPPQSIICLYTLPQVPNSRACISIIRPFLPSEWQVIFSTCTPLNPAYQKEVLLIDDKDYPLVLERFNMTSSTGQSLPDGLQLICAQEEKTNIPNKE